MQRIFIRYLAGSRANQADEFFQSGQELVAGRDPAAHIRFDPDRDDLVSRQHLKIVVSPVGGFQLIDLQSRNGTFLNRQRVFGSIAINHNDVVMLGAGGPEFRFELDPPPMLPPSLPGSPAIAKPTRESWMPDPSTPSASPRPVGRATVERMLGDVFTRMRQDGRRSMWGAILAVAILAALLLGFGVYFLKSRQQMQTSIKSVAEENQKSQQQMEEELKKTPQAAEEAKKRVERLEAQLRMSDERNSANQKALMLALENAKKQSAALSRMLEQQKAKAAAAAAEQAKAVAPVVPYETALADAGDKLEKGQVSAALDIATRLIQQDPNRWEAYGIAGESYAKSNDLKAAEDMFERAVARASGESRSVLEEQLKGIRERQK
jgi:hypothetical protein